MPLQITLELEVAEPVALLGRGGEALYGLVLSILSRRDRIRAHQVHQDPAPPPFALSDVLGTVERQGRQILLQPNQPYRFVLSLLDDELAPLFLETLLAGPRDPWRLGQAPIQRIQPADLRLKTYAELQTPAHPSVQRLRFRFLTPTSFRFHDLNWVFPDPDRVFRSLWTRWHRYAPVALGDPPEFSRIRVERYHLETRAVHFYRYLVVGFVGEVHYRIPEDLQANPVLQILTAFAPFAGVGYQTARGLGRVRTWLTP